MQVWCKSVHHQRRNLCWSKRLRRQESRPAVWQVHESQRGDLHQLGPLSWSYHCAVVDTGKPPNLYPGPSATLTSALVLSPCHHLIKSGVEMHTPETQACLRLSLQPLLPALVSLRAQKEIEVWQNPIQFQVTISDLPLHVA